MEDFKILLDDYQDSYFPGNSLNGHVLIKCSKSIHARNIVIRIYGHSNVRWREQNIYTCARRSYGVVRKSEIKILDQQIKIWECQEDERLLEGENRFNFSFQLPHGLSPSFKTKNGEVYYKLEAKINVPMRFDKTIKLVIKIASFLDLNSLIGADQPIQRSNALFPKNNFNITAHLSKSGFAIGEQIECLIEIQSRPEQYVKSIKMSLIKFTICKSEQRKKSEIQTISSNGININENNTQTCHKVYLLVPQCISSFDTSNFIVSYLVEVRIRINGKFWDDYPEIFMGVKIGTVPVKSCH
ncbi:Arrestin-C domain-containing protein [Aphelenchoides bicaudatus]|nr:Arrestin-C domain-containing protein [Aphelenchoides bicaudatus]